MAARPDRGLFFWLLAIAALTWGAWALIGLLSGHMYVLLSRRGSIHLSGTAAILFAAARSDHVAQVIRPA